GQTWSDEVKLSNLTSDSPWQSELGFKILFPLAILLSCLLLSTSLTAIMGSLSLALIICLTSSGVRDLAGSRVAMFTTHDRFLISLHRDRICIIIINT